MQILFAPTFMARCPQLAPFETVYSSVAHLFQLVISTECEVHILSVSVGGKRESQFIFIMHLTLVGYVSLAVEYGTRDV